MIGYEKIDMKSEGNRKDGKIGNLNVIGKVKKIGEMDIHRIIENLK